MFRLIVAKELKEILSSTKFAMTFGVCSLLIILAFLRPRLGPRAPWSDRYFEVDTSFVTNPDSTAIIQLGGQPHSFVIPEFPPGVRFLRPEGNLRLREQDDLMKQVRRALSTHEGPLFVLYTENDRILDLERSAKRYSLAIDSTHCFSLQTNIQVPIKVCPATRE